MCFGRLYEQFIFISRSNIIKLIFLISTLFDTHFLFRMPYKNIIMLSLNAIFRIFYPGKSTIRVHMRFGNKPTSEIKPLKWNPVNEIRGHAAAQSPSFVCLVDTQDSRAKRTSLFWGSLQTLGIKK